MLVAATGNGDFRGWMLGNARFSHGNEGAWLEWGKWGTVSEIISWKGSRGEVQDALRRTSLGPMPGIGR